ncbi:MAG: anaerobic ribonucleoside-triphosphate reductase activating protein [Desulfurococcaceae archaeon]
MICKLYASGYRDLSLIDIYGSVSFTLWLCGCNYNCPFCHNWKLAVKDPDICKWILIEDIIEKLKHMVKLIDYVHVTGGEPLLQTNCLLEFYSKTRVIGLKNSINSNLSNPSNLSKLLDEKLLDHVASDLKIPFTEMTGLDKDSYNYWKSYVESLEVIAQYNALFELRIPVAKELTIRYISEVLSELKNILSKMKNYYVIVFPLIGKPIVSVRDEEWCSKYCYPSREEVFEISRIVKELLDTNVIVKYRWNIG